jgi:hypothetical protein
MLTQLPTQEDKDRTFPPEQFAELSAPNPPQNPSIGDTSPLPSLQFSLARLTSSNRTLPSRHQPMMDQGDFQMQLLPVDIDIDWSLLEDDWSFG